MTRCHTLLAGGPLLLALTLATASASAQIKQPGAHPHYSVEVDPHFVLQYGDGVTADRGFGLGARIGIPLMHNGPVPQINNNLAISFGLDWVHFGEDEGCRRRGSTFYAEHCSGMNLWFPGAAEWNFFLTRSISVFLDLGLALQYNQWTLEGTCAGGPCSDSDSDVDLEFVSWVGGRFLVFGDRGGFTVRLGWPYAALGGVVLF